MLKAALTARGVGKDDERFIDVFQMTSKGVQYALVSCFAFPTSTDRLLISPRPLITARCCVSHRFRSRQFIDRNSSQHVHWSYSTATEFSEFHAYCITSQGGRRRYHFNQGRGDGPYCWKVRGSRRICLVANTVCSVCF